MTKQEAKKKAGKSFDAKVNYNETKKAIGYVPRKKATQETYDRLGFMSGLEVHQQLKTDKKLFCNCPAGYYQKSDQFDAELIRHMRPTLSELGEYDGTALMEFKTRKQIVYRIKNQTACTYDVDDTPPFPINKQALEIALEISMLSKMNVVGEVHITRKQYLDGSIPTGFQRTAIIGVEGEIPLKNKKIRLIQLSIEEDSCREVTDIGHTRIYRTDRLGVPLIETVTYPECLNPDEIKEACNYIRFLNRSTGKVRTGIGAGREDVNVSCKGGTRVEIKGVAHTRWIPELTHNECFRQWALLHIRETLLKRIPDYKNWKIQSQIFEINGFASKNAIVKDAKSKKYKFVAVNLPGFHGMLSHFDQPGKVFADEFTDRLKVIACLEKPNMTHSESLEKIFTKDDYGKLKELLHAGENDAQIVFWGPEEDIKTALETIEERALMAFEGVPKETRKSFDDGTTIFERVLPGADRMYPDTDSAPIPLEDEYIERLKKNLPSEVMDRYQQMVQWGIPEDTYTYILKKNLFPLIEKIINELNINPSFVGTFFGHTLKYVEGHNTPALEFDCKVIFAMFRYLLDKKLDLQLAKRMIPVIYQHPKMDFDSVLVSIGFKHITKEDLLAKVPFLKKKFAEIHVSKLNEHVEKNWIMGQLNSQAVGNVNLTEFSEIVSSL